MVTIAFGRCGQLVFLVCFDIVVVNWCVVIIIGWLVFRYFSWFLNAHILSMFTCEYWRLALSITLGNFDWSISVLFYACWRVNFVDRFIDHWVFQVHILTIISLSRVLVFLIFVDVLIFFISNPETIICNHILSKSILSVTCDVWFIWVVLLEKLLLKSVLAW